MGEYIHPIALRGCNYLSLPYARCMFSQSLLERKGLKWDIEGVDREYIARVICIDNISQQIYMQIVVVVVIVIYQLLVVSYD